MKDLLIVTAQYDANTALWSAASTDLGGVFLQATSWQALVDSVPDAVGDLLPRGLFCRSRDIAIEVVAHTSTLCPRRASTNGLGGPAFSIHSPSEPVGRSGCRDETVLTRR
jgi:hypothetical protein